MVIRNISEAKAELSELIAVAEQGDEVILAESGQPVAKILPYEGVGQSRIPGLMKGEFWMAPDFDELPEDMAEAFGMIEPVSEILPRHAHAFEFNGVPHPRD